MYIILSYYFSNMFQIVDVFTCYLTNFEVVKYDNNVHFQRLFKPGSPAEEAGNSWVLKVKLL